MSDNVNFDHFDAQTQSDEYYEGKDNENNEIAADFLDFPDDFDRETGEVSYEDWQYPYEQEEWAV